MTAGTRSLPPGRYRFRHVARMEWVKLASLRSTWATLGITIAAAAGIAALAAAGTSKTPSQDPVNSMMTGMFAGVLLAGVLGVLAVTSEYTSGTIRATLAAAPRRPLVLAAKAAVFGIVTLITGLLGLGLGAIIRHTAAAVTVLAGIVYAGELFIGQLDRTIDAYLPAYIVGDTLGGRTCGPGAVGCPLPAWAAMSVLAAYAAAALLIGGCILAWRDA
jgi:ABC-2 type transport system permease protein